ncbi:hypothetical protein B0H17DRAFT_1182984 [Mycena rosella]|uniref:F-box domain-containing protein n=1 Tax=Mycena rosella TaxID=1033263 RepID=A0AAD7G7N5_MYCRO|nr:hypothetical protein B0H17DRAFT_1182984 [Mycena rosella]
MRSPPRRKAISEWLPNEIMNEIFQVASRADQAALCRISRLFHALCLAVLYRVVHLQTDASLVAFCSAILSNSALPELVRSFTVIAESETWRISIEGWQLLKNSLKTLIRLEHLSFDAADTPGLFRCTFPHLVSCILGIGHWTSTERENSAASFLLRHPALKSLDLLYPLDVRPTATARIPLLHLQRLRCPFRIVPGIEARCLEFARLDWEFGEEANDLEAIIVALKSMTHRDVPFICANDDCDDYFPEILASISRNIPYTKTLQMSMILLPQEHARSEIISHFTNYLPRFTSLLFLSLDVSFDCFGTNDAEDQISVQGLGDVCSTLVGCCLSGNAWRKVSGTWEKYPLEEFMALAGID